MNVGLFRIFTYFIAIGVCSFASAAAQSDRAPDWEKQAFTHLKGFKNLNNTETNVPVDADYLAAVKIESEKRFRASRMKNDPKHPVSAEQVADNNMRCVRKNNYWCIKNKSRWPGVLGEDREGHAVFSKPEFAARAKASVMRRFYFDCKFKTLAQLMCAYAPANDCVGSGFGRAVNGKCVERQDCINYAKFLAKRMKIPLNVDAKLFTSSGKATERLQDLMRYTPVFETGFFEPKQSLIQAGISLEAAQWRELLSNQQKRLPNVCGK
jgi:hypothetical protein